MLGRDDDPHPSGAEDPLDAEFAAEDLTDLHWNRRRHGTCLFGRTMPGPDARRKRGERARERC